MSAEISSPASSVSSPSALGGATTQASLSHGDLSRTLSESTCSYMHELLILLLYLHAAIKDLYEVKMFLKGLVEWQDLGLALGLFYPTLEIIENDNRDKIDKCKTKLLVAWLQQQDNVSQKGIPSWPVLRAKLHEIGENELANRIVSR